MLLTLINIANPEAFNTVVSLVVSDFLGSYMLPVLLLLIKRVQGERIDLGPWSMGRAGGWLNAFALV